MSRVLVVGAWHLGMVTGACLADAGHTVYLWDQSEAVAKSWRVGKPPLQETGIDELIAKHWGTKLFWTEQPERNVDWVVLSYDTPVDEHDIVDVTPIREGMAKVLKAGLKSDVCFFLTAQLPVGTSRELQNDIKRLIPSWSGRVIYSPENLRLGNAISSFKTPDRVVVGSDFSSEAEKKQIEETCRSLLGLATAPIVVMGLESSEMVKHSLNAFLANCIVFANEVSDVCEANGADAWDVLSSLKQDSRVGPKAFLKPGLGFAGGTLARDVRILSDKIQKRESGRNLFSTLYGLNEERNDWIVRSLETELKTLKGRRIVLLGVTYKVGTSTLRRSPALDIAGRLRKAGATVTATDPQADLGELSEADRKNIPFTFEPDVKTALEGSDAAVLVTPWPQFRDVPWDKLKMNRVMIDPSGFYETLREFKRIVPGRTK